MSDLALPGELEVVPLARLCEAPWNYKEDDDDMQAKLVANMRRNGQIVNLNVRVLDEVDGDGQPFLEVIDGNHRLRALRQIDLEAAYVFNHGRIALSEAQRLSTELNEMWFSANTMQLAKMMQAVEDDFDRDELLATSPFDADTLDNFNALLTFNWEDLQDPEPTSDDGPEYFSLKARLPVGVKPTWREVADRASIQLREAGTAIADNKEIHNGQVIEAICTEYLATVGDSTDP